MRREAGEKKGYWEKRKVYKKEREREREAGVVAPIPLLLSGQVKVGQGMENLNL